MISFEKTRIAGVYIEEKTLTQEQEAAQQEMFLREIENRQKQRADAEKNGLTALQRVVEVARCDTGQSQVCGRFLLGLYNGYAFPFNLIDLRRLDESLWNDCISVLKLDKRPKKEIHLLINDGHSIWEELKVAWATDRRSE